MLIKLNKREACTIVINHTDINKTHSVVVSNFDNKRLSVREFPPLDDEIKKRVYGHIKNQINRECKE